MFWSLITLLSALTVFSNSAQAEVQLRLAYGLSAVSPQDFNQYTRETYGVAALNANTEQILDLRFSPKNSSYFFGIRRVQMTKVDSQTGIMNSTAGEYGLNLAQEHYVGMAGAQLLTRDLYASLALGMGLSQRSSLSITFDADETIYRPDTESITFLAFEYGVFINKTIVGLEINVSQNLLSGLTDENGLTIPDLNLTGPKAVFHLGYRF